MFTRRYNSEVRNAVFVADFITRYKYQLSFPLKFVHPCTKENSYHFGTLF